VKGGTQPGKAVGSQKLKKTHSQPDVVAGRWLFKASLGKK
jgi:hypothetical protein